jgi:hypothetical protein
MRVRRTVAGVAVAALASALPLAAQEPPGDTVRVEMARLAWMDACALSRDYVLDGQGALDALRKSPLCAYLPATMDLSRNVRVGVREFVDCHAVTALVAHRSDSLRVLRVSLVVRDGGCHAMRPSDYRWVEVPRPPAGYRVEVARWERPGVGAGPDSVFAALARAAEGQPSIGYRGAFDGGQRPPDGGVPVAFERVDMGGCRTVGSFILDGREALDRLRRYPQCAHLSARMEFGEHVLVGVAEFVDCHAHVGLSVWRVDAEERVAVTSSSRDGGCRAMRHAYHWIRMARPPWGYRIGETQVRYEGPGGLAPLFGGIGGAMEVGDSVPVDHRPRGVSLGQCSPVDGFVLDGPEALARLRALPQCADVTAGIDLRDRVLVHVYLHGSCGGPGTSVTASRIDAARLVRVTATWVDRMCRSATTVSRWIAIPRPPAGYRVELERRRVERGADQVSRGARASGVVGAHTLFSVDSDNTKSHD